MTAAHRERANLIADMRRMGAPANEFALWSAVLASTRRKFERTDPRGYLLRRCRKQPVRA